jgi:hypothetical protein
VFAKPLLNNGSCIFAYLAVVAQQRVCMLQYIHTDVSLIHTTFYRYVLNIRVVRELVGKHTIRVFLKNVSSCRQNHKNRHFERISFGDRRYSFDVDLIVDVYSSWNY